MSIKGSRHRWIAAATLLLLFVSYVHAFQTTPSEQIKGATVQFRIYELTVDQTTNEIGTRTAYLSSNGNWTTIKRNAHGALSKH